VPVDHLPDGTPVVRFAPGLEISPYELFRGLADGRPFRLLDVREEPGALSFDGARPFVPGVDEVDGEDLGEGDTILFDEDGSEAFALARELQGRGFKRVRALFGGLRLYDFALDPEVVGAERFLAG
jgi:hypothetical protein